MTCSHLSLTIDHLPEAGKQLPSAIEPYGRLSSSCFQSDRQICNSRTISHMEPQLSTRGLSVTSSHTSPVACCTVCIWEEVIRLEGPRGVVLVLGISVGVWRGIEHIQAAILVSVVYQLVHILVPARHCSASSCCLCICFCILFLFLPLICSITSRHHPVGHPASVWQSASKEWKTFKRSSLLAPWISLSIFLSLQGSMLHFRCMTGIHDPFSSLSRPSMTFRKAPAQSSLWRSSRVMATQMQELLWIKLHRLAWVCTGFKHARRGLRPFQSSIML